MPHTGIWIREMHNEKYQNEDIPNLEAEIQRLRTEVNGLGMKFEIARSMHGDVRTKVFREEKDRLPIFVDHFVLVTDLECLLKLKSTRKTMCRYCLSTFTKNSGLAALHEKIYRANGSTGTLPQTTTFREEAIKFERVEACMLKSFRG